MPILLTISIWMWNVLKKETKYIEKQKKNLEKNGKKSYMLYVKLWKRYSVYSELFFIFQTTQ